MSTREIRVVHLSSLNTINTLLTNVTVFFSHVHSFLLVPFYYDCFRFLSEIPHSFSSLVSEPPLAVTNSLPVFLIVVTVLKRALLDCYHYSKMPEINNEEQKGLHCIKVWSSHSRMAWSHHVGFLTRVGHCRRAGHSPPESGSEEKMRATGVQKLLPRHIPEVPKASYHHLPVGKSGEAKLNTGSFGTLIQT